jgi:hypothetical protein
MIDRPAVSVDRLFSSLRRKRVCWLKATAGKALRVLLLPLRH